MLKRHTVPRASWLPVIQRSYSEVRACCGQGGRQNSRKDRNLHVDCVIVAFKIIKTKTILPDAPGVFIFTISNRLLNKLDIQFPEWRYPAANQILSVSYPLDHGLRLQFRRARTRTCYPIRESSGFVSVRIRSRFGKIGDGKVGSNVCAEIDLCSWTRVCARHLISCCRHSPKHTPGHVILSRNYHNIITLRNTYNHQANTHYSKTITSRYIQSSILFD